MHGINIKMKLISQSLAFLLALLDLLLELQVRKARVKKTILCKDDIKSAQV